MREPETQVLQLAFPEFVKCSAAWRTRRLYVRVRTGMSGVGWGGVGAEVGATSRGSHLVRMLCMWPRDQPETDLLC